MDTIIIGETRRRITCLLRVVEMPAENLVTVEQVADRRRFIYRTDEVLSWPVVLCLVCGDEWCRR